MSNGKLRRINSLKFIDLEGLFIEKYQIRSGFTKSFVKMLKCMFSVMVKDRLSAKNLLKKDFGLQNFKTIFMNDIEWQSYIWNQREIYERFYHENIAQRGEIRDGVEISPDLFVEGDEENSRCCFDDRLTKSEDIAELTVNSSEGSFFSFEQGNFADSNPIDNGKNLAFQIDRSFVKGDFYLGYDEGIDPTNLDLIEHLQFKPTAQEDAGDKEILKDLLIETK